jgi:hypothetical protein
VDDLKQGWHLRLVETYWPENMTWQKAVGEAKE